MINKRKTLTTLVRTVLSLQVQHSQPLFKLGGMMIIIYNSFRFLPGDEEVTILLIFTYPIYKGQQYFNLWKLLREGVTGAHIRSGEGQILNTFSATPFSINTPLFFCFWQKLWLCPHFHHIYSDIYRTVWKSSELGSWEKTEFCVAVNP